MKLPIAFPSDLEKLERDVAEYRHCTAEERIQSLLDISLLCEEIRRSSPTAELQRQLLEKEEEAENDLWRKLIQKHGRGQGASKKPP